MNKDVFYSEPMVLRFDSYENRIAKGKVQTIYYRTPFKFESLDHLFMIMDDVLDSIYFPRREGNLRHIYKKNSKNTVFQKVDQTEYIENEWKSAGISNFHGHMTIVVNRREHSSMQGTIVLNGNKINFRSALELMHMFHEYLEKRF